ncbi:hypothetical protein ABE504_25155 [Paenibacillus oryzisoli]|uniref:hypothetical protein n=1 Tax=Paenibacillus oryzisoli TaxID=1850517 RepID=UPI003D28555E
MSLEPFVEFSRNMTLSQVIEAAATNFQNTEWLLQGGLDELNIRRVNAEKIYTGTLDTGKVTIYGKDGSYFYSIDKNGITANNGSEDTLKFDLATGLLTIVSALIQSAMGFPRVELDPTNNNFRIEQDATTNITFNPNYLGTTPVINFHDGAFDGYIGYFNALNKLALTTPDDGGVEVEISNGGLSGDVSLRPADNLNVPRWSNVWNEPDGVSLQTELDQKANGSGINGTVYVASTSGGPATTPITFVDGVRVS